MKILESLLSQLPAEPVAIQNVIIGVHWTLVSGKYTGLASTMINEGPHGGPGVRDVGSLEQKSVQELAQWVLSDNLLEASLGMAAINSLMDIDESRMVQINAAEVIARESKDKNLVIVGHFPFIERMKSIARDCRVIEKHPYAGDLPEEASSEFIPKADVIAITGTALINHTMEGLLSLCRPDSLVLVLGPSTPLSPILFQYGISFLSGSRVVDKDAAIKTVQQGASFPQVKGVKLFTMQKENF
jgi:uncharacterized protein (DUF4213/DUF364 family)